MVNPAYTRAQQDSVQSDPHRPEEHPSRTVDPPPAKTHRTSKGTLRTMPKTMQQTRRTLGVPSLDRPRARPRSDRTPFPGPRSRRDQAMPR
eukprot:8837538-Pyramimonas_sp.AAC.1